MNRRDALKAMPLFLGLVGIEWGGFAPARAAAGAGPEFSVSNFGARGDGVSDDSSAFLSALKEAERTKGTVLVPLPALNYRVTKGLQVSPGIQIRGVGGTKRPLIVFEGDVDVCLNLRSNSLVEGLELDGHFPSKTRTSTVLRIFDDGVQVINCVIRRGKTLNVDLQAANCRIVGGEQWDSDGTSIALNGIKAHSNTLSGITFGNNRGFAIWLNDKAHGNLIENNKTKKNGLELCGVTFDCYGNNIVGNSAEGSGDNGISVTGYNNKITKNNCVKNAYHGICLFGERNYCSDNICTSNGQANLSLLTPRSFCGIAVTPNFGGFGRRNVIENNTCTDDQANPTQLYGLKLERHQYRLWKGGLELALDRRYSTDGKNVYRAMGRLASQPVPAGTRPIIHTSGTASDGRFDWLWIGSNEMSFDLTPQAWQTGTTVSDGDERASNHALYKAVGSGVCGANAPVHKAGVVSDGGRDWQYIDDFPPNFDAWGNVMRGNRAKGNKISDYGVMSKNRNLIEKV